MDNFYIVRFFDDWKVKRVSYLDHVLTRLVNMSGVQKNLRTAHAIDVILSRIRGGREYQFASSGDMTNVEQRMNLYHLVRQVLAYNVEGDLVEMGCNEGATSVLIARILKDNNSEKKLFLYDSFEGLPSPSLVDGVSFKIGDLVTTEDNVRANFRKHNLPLPEIHKGWFKDTIQWLPEKICFAYLDGDFYDSILDSLVGVYPRMSKGAICLIDDYCDPGVNPNGLNRLPGVKKACDDFFADKPEKIEFIYSGHYPHGYFRKL